MHVLLNPKFVSNLTWSLFYKSYHERGIFVPFHHEVCPNNKKVCLDKQEMCPSNNKVVRNKQ